MPLFAVNRGRGPSWDHARPIDGQQGWPAHAAFMDALYEEVFCVLAGPLEEFREALLVVRAESADEVRERLAADPWKQDMLQTLRIAEWTLRLGTLGG